jgi:hypothetical protein
MGERSLMMGARGAGEYAGAPVHGPRTAQGGAIALFHIQLLLFHINEYSSRNSQAGASSHPARRAPLFSGFTIHKGGFHETTFR